MRPFSQWFRSGSNDARARADDQEKQLADLEAEALNAQVGSKGNALNRAGDLCLRAGDKDRAVAYYGRSIDAMLQDGHPEPARGMAKKIIRIRPQAVRTLCTLTWLDLASRHTAMALVHLQQYVDAAKRGRRGDLAREQVLAMAQTVTHPEFLEAAAEALKQLDGTKDAERVLSWASEGGAPDAVTDPDELAIRCMREAVGSNAARRAEGASA